MPRYYYDIDDGSEIRDQIGREIDDPQTLRRDALKVVTALSASEGEDSDGCSIVLRVRDQRGAIVLVLRMVCQVDEPQALRLRLAS